MREYDSILHHFLGCKGLTTMAMNDTSMAGGRACPRRRPALAIRKQERIQKEHPNLISQTDDIQAN